MDTAENPRIFIGANNPPAEYSPFDLSKVEIDDLYGEAKNWLDGEPIATQGQADDIAKLVSALREAAKTADERRKVEKKPHDDAAKAVQEKWRPIIGNAETAIDVCKKALSPFLEKQEAEKRAAAAAAAELAAQKQTEAAAAMRAAQASADLSLREEAETLAISAKLATGIALSAAKRRAQAAGGSRAMSLRTSYRAKVEDDRAFAAFVWTHHKSDLTEFLSALAQRLVDAKSRDIPGVKIIEEKRAV